MKSLICAAVAVIGLAGGAYAGTAADQLGLDKADAAQFAAPAPRLEKEGPYLPSLKSIANADIVAGLKKARSLIFEWKESPAAPRFAIPWTYLNGNHCADRALVTYLGLATRDALPVLKNPLPQADADAYINSPAIEAAKIDLIAPMNAKQTLYFPNGKSKDYPIIWTHHIALVVNVDGQLMVADLAASDTPIRIKDWINMYYREDDKTTCPNLNDEEYVALFNYETCLNNGWIPGPHGEVPVCTAPKLTCGYKFTDLSTLGFDPAVQGDGWGGLTYAVDVLGYNFSRDLIGLETDMGLKLDPVKEVSDLRSKLTLEYPSNWVRKY